MMARYLVGNHKQIEYDDNCIKYDEIINMFKELGTGKLNRRDVLSNVKAMVDNDIAGVLEQLIDDIEEYERW